MSALALAESDARLRALLEVETVGIVFFDDIGGIPTQTAPSSA